MKNTYSLRIVLVDLSIIETFGSKYSIEQMHPLKEGQVPDKCVVCAYVNLINMIAWHHSMPTAYSNILLTGPKTESEEAT